MVIPSSQSPTPPSDPAEAAGSSEEAIRRTVSEDPLFVFIREWWRHMVAALVLVLAVVYAQQAFETTRQESLQRASDVFDNLRVEFGELSEMTEDVDQAKLDRLFSYVEALESERAPYNELASLYAGLIHLEQGDIESAGAYLDLKKWSEVSASNSSERFVGELGALALARAMLDQDEAEIESVRAALIDLAQNGEFVSISAALTLHRIAQNPEQIEVAKAIVEELSQKNPEQSNLLRDELTMSGG